MEKIQRRPAHQIILVNITILITGAVSSRKSQMFSSRSASSSWTWAEMMSHEVCFHFGWCLRVKAAKISWNVFFCGSFLNVWSWTGSRLNQVQFWFCDSAALLSVPPPPPSAAVPAGDEARPPPRGPALPGQYLPGGLGPDVVPVVGPERVHGVHLELRVGSGPRLRPGQPAGAAG